MAHAEIRSNEITVGRSPSLVLSHSLSFWRVRTSTLLGPFSSLSSPPPSLPACVGCLCPCHPILRLALCPCAIHTLTPFCALCAFFPSLLLSHSNSLLCPRSLSIGSVHPSQPRCSVFDGHSPSSVSPPPQGIGSDQQGINRGSSTMVINRTWDGRVVKIGCQTGPERG